MRRHITSAALAFASVATGLSAQTAIFAQFAPVKPGQKLLVFDNDRKCDGSIAATLGTGNLCMGVDVNFAFSSNLKFSGALAPLNNPHEADFIMQSKTDDKAVRGLDDKLLQPIDSGTMEFRLETPVDGKDLLLGVAFSEVPLFTSHSLGLELAGKTILGNSKITYFSDFLDFNPLALNSWGIALSDIDPSSRIGCDGPLNDFSASALGIFLSTANPFQNAGTPVSPIPEPGTYGVVAALISLAAVLMRRRWTKLFPGGKLVS